MDKNLASYPLLKGIDTKNAVALVPSDEALTLQNIVFIKGERGSLAKRFGYDAFPKGIVPGIGLALFVNAPVAGQEELSVCARSTLNNPVLYSYSPDAGAWVQREGLAPALAIAESAVGGVTVPQTGGDTDQVQGVGVYAWEQAGGIWYSVIDESNGTQIVPATQLSTNGTKCRVRAIGSLVYVFWVVGLNLFRAAINPANPAATPTAINTLVSTDTTFWDVAIVEVSLQFYAIFAVGATPIITRFAVPAWTSTGFTPYSANVFDQGISCCIMGNSFLLVGLKSNNQTVYSASFDSTTLAYTGTTYSVTVPSGNVPQVIDIQPAPVAGFFAFAQVMIQTKVVADDPNGTSLYFYAIDATGNPGLSVPRDFARGVGLASKQFQFTGLGGQDVCVFAVLPDTNEPVTYLLKAGGQVIAKVLQDQGGLLPEASGIVPFVHVSGDFQFTTALSSLRYEQIVPSEANPNVPEDTFVYGLERIVASPGTYRHAPMGPVQGIATGALLQEYDGDEVVEAGFNYAPRAPVAVMENAGIQAIVTVPQNGVNTVDQVSQIVVPNNINDGQAAGLFINPGIGLQPGDYITFGFASDGATASDAAYVWFSIDGAGSDPGLASPFNHALQCSLTTAMSSSQIAHAIGEALHDVAILITAGQPGAAYLDSFTSTLPGPSRALAATNQGGTGNHLYAPPCFNRQFLMTMIENESDGGANRNITVVCLPVGKVITAGQYFGVPAAGNAYSYFWFKVDGEGSAPPGLTPVTEVDIASSDTAEQVTTKFGLTIAGAGFTGTVSANQCRMKSTAGGAATGPATPYISLTGSPGFNHLGTGEGVINLGTSHTDPGSVVVDYGAYIYEDVYSATNAQGQVAYSAPSVPLLATVPGFQAGAMVGVLTVSSRTLRLTARDSVNVELYRSQGDADVLTRVSTQPNDPTVDNLTFLDTLADPAIAGLVQLYTTGGVLPNDSPPATGFIAAVDDRIWLTDAEDGSVAWFSKPFAPGLSIGWSAFFTKHVGQDTGALLGVSGIDGNVHLFGSKQIVLYSGTGPNNLGQGDFTGPTLVSPALGVRDAGSICPYENGIVFKSPKGIQAMARGLSLVFIGNNVEGFNADVISKITVLPGTTELRCLSASGSTLMWDYFYGQWSQFTNHQGVDAGIYQGKYVYLRNDGTVYQENESWGDAGVPYGYYIEGPWYKLDEKQPGGEHYQGRKRVWNLFVKGSFTGANPVRVTLYTNYNGTTNSYTPTPDYQ